MTTVRYPTPTGETKGDLYLPVTKGPHPGVVVCLGVVPDGEEHPQVAVLGRALARAGFATLMFWSPAMRDLRLDPADVPGIAMAYRWLIDRPDIDAAKSGLLGTCVGGSFALMAAAEPLIADEVGFVIAWAPYGSIQRFAADIASGSVVVDGVSEPWQVDQLTRRVFARCLGERVSPQNAGEVETDFDRTIAERDARAVTDLLMATNREQANRALSALSDGFRAKLEAISPDSRLAGLKAPMVLLSHDRNDPVIPVSESHRLVSEFGDRAGVRYTEFTMFRHLDPTKVHLSRFALARELWRFGRAVYPVFRLSLC